MVEKEYFAKVSWDKNEIIREHMNISFTTDITQPIWGVVNDAKDAAGRKYDDDANFTIDFMIEIPKED